MALSARGRVAVTLLVLLIIAGVGGYLLFFKNPPGDATGKTKDGELATCPLTGLKAAGGVPDRPALAIKVENLPAARPQAGIDKADIVYEEPVEGGITRFIAVFQCQDAKRVGPVRSGRLVDPVVLTQFGKNTMFGYAGGVPQVIKAVKKSGIIDVNYNIAVDAYHRDPNRAAPHNLYTSTGELYGFEHNPKGQPAPVFRYSDRTVGTPKAAKVVHIPFSSSSDVFWKWSKKKNAYLRSHGSTPHVLEGGVQVRAANVLVQTVETRCSGIFDVNGVCSPEVAIVGSGSAILFRDGKAFTGKWVREFPEDVTVFKESGGRQFTLSAGTTWIEMVPTDIVTTYSAKK